MRAVIFLGFFAELVKRSAFKREAAFCRPVANNKIFISIALMKLNNLDAVLVLFAKY